MFKVRCAILIILTGQNIAAMDGLDDHEGFNSWTNVKFDNVTFDKIKAKSTIESASAQGNIKILSSIIENYSKQDFGDQLSRAFLIAAENNKPESMRTILSYVDYSELSLHWNGYIWPLASCPTLLDADYVYRALQVAREKDSKEILELFSSLNGKLKLCPSPLGYFTWTIFSYEG